MAALEADLVGEVALVGVLAEAGPPASTRRISAVSVRDGRDPAAREGRVELRSRCRRGTSSPAANSPSARQRDRAPGGGERCRARPVEADLDEFGRAIAYRHLLEDGVLAQVRRDGRAGRRHGSSSRSVGQGHGRPK